MTKHSDVIFLKFNINYIMDNISAKWCQKIEMIK